MSSFVVKSISPGSTKEEEKRRRRRIIVFNDTIQGPRLSVVKPGHITQA
jgi:hypothetical protein